MATISSNVPIKSATGGTIGIASLTLIDGTTAPKHILCDETGTPYGPTNPMHTAPAIASVAFTDRSGAIAAAGAVALDIAADTTRKGGAIRANLANTGTITVTLKDGNGNTHAELLEAGATLPLTVNGYVIQDEIAISGDTVGDKFTGVTYA